MVVGKCNNDQAVVVGKSVNTDQAEVVGNSDSGCWEECK